MRSSEAFFQPILPPTLTKKPISPLMVSEADRLSTKQLEKATSDATTFPLWLWDVGSSHEFIRYTRADVSADHAGKGG